MYTTIRRSTGNAKGLCTRLQSTKASLRPDVKKFARDGLPHQDPELVEKHKPHSRMPSRPRKLESEVEPREPFDVSRRARSPRADVSRPVRAPKTQMSRTPRLSAAEMARSVREPSVERVRPAPTLPSIPTTPLSRPTKEDRFKRLKSILTSLDETGTEFYNPPTPASLSEQAPPLPTEAQNLPQRNFNSPPLLPGFLPVLENMLGTAAKPTAIQSLSIKWIIEQFSTTISSLPENEWKRFLLAAETGSGKSIAYLLPVLQHLKMAEESGAYDPSKRSYKRVLNPRAIILAPTHELARQLSSFTKALTKEVRLRAMCVSQANTPSTTKREVTARKLSEQMDAVVNGAQEFDIDASKDKFPVDILVGTPVKLMELLRGRGWDRREEDLDEEQEGKLRRGRDKMPGFGKWRQEPQLGLENVEWVVVDEADVLFDPDFQEITRTFLADISAARGKPVKLISTDNTLLSSFTPTSTQDKSVEPINYPFNLILTSATIPKNFASYLDKHHPDLIRLTTPRLHHLPRGLKTEYVPWTGGNKIADIERKIKLIWADDAMAYSIVNPNAETEAEKAASLSKILIFCNRSSKVVDLAAELEERGIRCVALTSNSEQRKRGSNKHLDGFLRPVKIKNDSEGGDRQVTKKVKKVKEANILESKDPKVTPHVMVTTSLLSRGLDFSPALKNVFIVDEPRNMVDFLHRAGRSGRAGMSGNVVIFTKMKGRGSSKSKDVKERVKALLKK